MGKGLLRAQVLVERSAAMVRVPLSGQGNPFPLAFSNEGALKLREAPITERIGQVFQNASRASPQSRPKGKDAAHSSSL